MKDPKDGEELLFIRDFDGLAALVQLGVVEVHIWGCTIDALEKPDQIIFDLDPDAGRRRRTRARGGARQSAASSTSCRLRESSSRPPAARAITCVVPLKPKADWDEVKSFSHDFAKALEQAEPDLYTATLSKKARTGRIFVDYLRNGRGSTTVAPYSTRAKKGATVSMPVTWAEVEAGLEPNSFPIGDKTTLKELAKADPWADFFKQGKPLGRNS